MKASIIQKKHPKREREAGHAGATWATFHLYLWILFPEFVFWRFTGLTNKENWTTYTFWINLILLTNSSTWAITSICKTSFCENLAPSTVSIKPFFLPLLTLTVVILLWHSSMLVLLLGFIFVFIL